MTMTMKKVLMVVLVAVMALSACLFGTVSTASANDAKSEFITIVETFKESPVTDADLAKEDVQVKLVNAKAYYDKMTYAERESLPSDIVVVWENIQGVAGPALEVYSLMTALSIYLRENDAPQISVSKETDVDHAELRYQLLGENTNLKKLVDTQIAYNNPTANPPKDFFPDLRALLAQAKKNIEDAIKAIDAIWEGVEKITFDRYDEIINAYEKINAVVAKDRALITNMDLFDKAVADFNVLIAEAQKFANEIDAVYAQVKSEPAGEEVYYSKYESLIKPLKDKLDNYNELDASFEEYFKGALIPGQGHKEQYDKLMAMLAYCEQVAKEIEKVIELIDAIGEVTYTDACKAKIDAARAAFEALDADVKNADYVTNYQDLLDAEKAYADMKAAIDAVVALIDAIPTPIVISPADCKNAIDAARKAYEALSDNYKANFPAAALEKLVGYEDAYAKRLAAVEAWIARVKAFYGEGAIADIWAADLNEIKALEEEFVKFEQDQQDYIVAKGADKELADIKVVAYANIDKTEAAIDELAQITLTFEKPETVEKFFEVKEMFDTLHKTQQDLVENKELLNKKVAAYEFATYFDKAVAEIEANVKAEKYLDQDKALANTLLAIYGICDEETKGLIKKHGDLLDCEAALKDKETVDAEDVSAELAAKIAELATKLDEKVAELKAAIEALEAKNDALAGEIDGLEGEIDGLEGEIAGLEGEIANLDEALAAAQKKATINLIIAIAATVIGAAAAVLVFVKK